MTHITKQIIKQVEFLVLSFHTFHKLVQFHLKERELLSPPLYMPDYPKLHSLDI